MHLPIRVHGRHRVQHASRVERGRGIFYVGVEPLDLLAEVHAGVEPVDRSAGWEIDDERSASALSALPATNPGVLASPA
ncbi:hypothetical protein, partial [Streptomyces sp. NPDC005077]|uniref:hypothetical protein n=1 Tax=Streptomyces sp. NPDC005077 TaxID=3154292 RepID=UPI0033B46CAA